MTNQRQRSRRDAAVRQPYQSSYKRSALATKKRRPNLRQVILISLGIIFIGFNLGFWRVQTINVETSSQSVIIKATAETILDAHWSQKSLFALSNSQLASQIQAQQGDSAAEVTVTKQWLKRALYIEVIGRSPTLLWQTNGNIYSVDQTGRIIQLIGSRPNLPLVIDTANVDVKPSDQVASAQFVNFVNDTAKLLPQIPNLVMTQAKIGDSTAEIIIETNAGYYLRMDTNRAVQEQVAALAAILADAKAKNISVKQYVDLRIAHKAYYR